MKKIRIAFVCTHNSCRSIMAEAWTKHLGSDVFDVYSAGTEQYPGPKPMAIEVMEDQGVDMSGASSKLIKDIPKTFDILVTMGCGVECPFVPCKYREDWGLQDPSGGPKADFEITRDLIKAKVLELISKARSDSFDLDGIRFNLLK